MDTTGRLGQEERMLRRVLGIGVLSVAIFGTVTLVALEGREVVVLRTHGADGTDHATRTWIADADGAAWVEAANPERPFLRDLAREATLTVDRHGRTQQCRATIAPNPEGHDRIRNLLATKYGWADCWIAMVADTERSLAVRLECDGAATGAEAG